ncbi:hypothetical protein GLAREA_10695 [Glarea lozoyensis ATCC 20868]|uniref:Uncharacterized protein n=1 Tax=Glarea lozoyensis (strain ATCC 20868 / MF5171) TaxID=1116229 RepID=S3DB79_GLAL2|nr:uncharacterized protein GLAREA_10695 [Glarea lozoyensis ATCC 20868]EPE35000.1 hypothetical protein GLAREA_10695 [Glarea lozoyensis ATCC 20868]
MSDQAFGTHWHRSDATARSSCHHEHLAQVRYGSLPPLYFTPSAQHAIQQNTLLHLERAQLDMGPGKPCPPALTREVNNLRKELSQGMSKERRKVLRQHVFSLRSEREKRVAELYLARFPGFLLDEDGRLDYGIGDWFESVVEEGDQERGKLCIVM